MNEQTTKLIEQLAQKLGTTSEHLWQVTVNQAQIMAITNLVYFITVILSGWVLYKYHCKFSKEFKNDSGYITCLYEQSDVKVGVMLALGFIWCVLFIVSFFTIGSIISGFLNPEYWALNKIMSIL